ncbi:hypothetical protein ACFRUQ_37630, partial [Streptomyces goshikiensis]
MRRTTALLAGGCRAVELTTTVPGWAGAVARTAPLSDAIGRPALIGVGTVTTAAQARTALDAGAAFLISPTRRPRSGRTPPNAGPSSSKAGSPPARSPPPRGSRAPPRCSPPTSAARPSSAPSKPSCPRPCSSRPAASPPPRP